MLKKLEASGKVVSKTFGKAVLYWPNQTDLATDTPAELLEKSARQKREKERIGRLKDEVAAAKAALGALAAEPTDKDLAAALASEQSEVQQLEARLAAVEDACKSGTAPTPAVKRKLMEQFSSRRAAWSKRKRIATERVHDMVDKQGGGKKQVAKMFDEIGVELDGVDGNPVLPDPPPIARKKPMAGKLSKHNV